MQAQSADGVIHDFPDSTDMSVVDRVMKDYASQAKPADAPQGQYTAPTGGEFGDLSAQPWAQGEQPDPNARAPAARIADAAVQGWKDTKPLLMPDAEAAVDKYGGVVGQTLVNPALKLAGGAIAAGHAGMAALTKAAMEVFGEKGGRDALALLSALPIAHGELMNGNHMKGATAAEATIPPPRFMNELTMPADTVGLTPLHRIQDLIAHDDATYPPRGPDAGVANQSIAEIGAAPNIDSAIAAAGKAVQAPAARPMSEWMQPLSKAAPEAPAESTVPQSMGDYLKSANRPAAEPVAAPQAQPAATEIPRTSAAAKQIASAYYQKADQVGGTLLPDFTNKLIDRAEATAPQTNEGQIIAGDSPITALVDRIQGLRDQPISLQGAQEIDEGLGNLIDKEFGPKGLTKDGKHLLDLQTTFRNMILDAGPEDTTGGTAGFEALKQGRAAWAQAMKMTDLERILDRAELTDNPATSIRSGIRVLLSNPSRARGYSPEEISALQEAADRGPLGSVLHVFGSRLMPLVAAGAGSAGGIPGAVMAGGVAHVGTTMLRNAASGMQTRRIGNAMSVLGEGVPSPPGP